MSRIQNAFAVKPFGVSMTKGRTMASSHSAQTALLWRPQIPDSWRVIVGGFPDRRMSRNFYILAAWRKYRLQVATWMIEGNGLFSWNVAVGAQVRLWFGSHELNKKSNQDTGLMPRLILEWSNIERSFFQVKYHLATTIRSYLETLLWGLFPPLGERPYSGGTLYMASPPVYFWLASLLLTFKCFEGGSFQNPSTRFLFCVAAAVPAGVTWLLYLGAI